MNIWKKVRLPLIIVVLGATAVFMVATMKPKPTPGDWSPPEAPKPQVNVVPAERQITRLSVKSQGTVAPRREIDIVSQVAGSVLSTSERFADGGFIKAGQELLQIDPRDYEAAYLTAKAQKLSAEQALAEERGQARQAKSEWRDLGNKDANDLFLRKPQLAAAEAQFASAQAGLKRAELDLERTKISVPFDGRIRETLADLGQYVSPGTSIAKVYDTAVAEIRLPLSDREAGLVNLPIGYSASDADNAPKVTISGVIGGKAYQWTGHIARTDASLDTQSRMYFAVAEVDDPFVIREGQETPLIVGMFVEAEIEGRQLDDVVVLPRNAVFKRNKVYALDEENKVREEIVTVVHRDEDNIWVRTELPEETQIIIEKQVLLAVGTEVEPVNMIAGNVDLADPTTSPEEALESGDGE